MKDTRISVCMASFNGEKYIREQLISILNQINESDEVIIVDDCSIDRTTKVIEDLQDSRIKLYINQNNLGVIKSFESAISKATGRFIFLSDQDDIWMPHKVDTLLKYFDKSHIDLIVSDAYIMNNNKIQLETFYEYRGSKSGIVNNLTKNSFIGCCMAFRVDVKEKVFPIPYGFSMHDLWIGLRILLHGKVEFVPERLVVYRRHDNNVTEMHRSSLTKMLTKRFLDTSYFIRQVLYDKF